MKHAFHFRLAVVLFIAMTAVSNVYSQTASKEETKTSVKDIKLLAAKWRAGDEEYTFEKSGASLITVNKRECPGKWILEGKTLTINPKKLMYGKDDPCSKTQILEVVSLSGNTLVIHTAENKELRLTRQK